MEVQVVLKLEVQEVEHQKMHQMHVVELVIHLQQILLKVMLVEIQLIHVQTQVAVAVEQPRLEQTQLFHKVELVELEHPIQY